MICLLTVRSIWTVVISAKKLHYYTTGADCDKMYWFLYIMACTATPTEKHSIGMVQKYEQWGSRGRLVKVFVEISFWVRFPRLLSCAEALDNYESTPPLVTQQKCVPGGTKIGTVWMTSAVQNVLHSPAKTVKDWVPVPRRNCFFVKSTEHTLIGGR